MMKKFLLIMLFLFVSVNTLYAVDDDSTPYYPYPEQPAQPPQPQNKTTTKKAPAKKKTTKKANTKKATKKKAAPAKPAAPRQTSLQKGIELIQQDRYEAAKNYLLKAIQENRNDPNVWYWYGVYHEKTGGFYQAQYFYSKAITIDPAFEPLSRVVYYPNDSEKTPLWDPKRPARVYPVETANNGVTIGRGNYPSAPNDPEMPKVPVYTPPEPGSNPLAGDSWAPAVYVPPNPEELPIREGTSPIYTPPQAQGIIAEEENTNAEIYSYRVPGYSETYTDNQIRADKPLYNPPAPDQVFTPKAQPTQQEINKARAASEKKEPVKQQIQIKQPPAPRKIVKQSEKKKNPTPKVTNNSATTKKQASTPAKKAQEQPKKTKQQTQNQKPSKPRQQSQQQQPQKKPEPERRQTQPQQQAQPVQPVTPVRPVEPEITQPERGHADYLPPVGQFSPDPGTIPEPLIPPVGQGNQD